MLSFACPTEAVRLSSEVDLWLTMLDQRLATELYAAHLAGLRWSFAPTDRGLQLSAAGFSDRLPALTVALLQKLLEWDGAAYAQLFERERERLVRNLRSHAKKRADSLAMHYLQLLLSPTEPGVAEQLEAAEKMTLADVQRVEGTQGKQQVYFPRKPDALPAACLPERGLASAHSGASAQSVRGYQMSLTRWD